MRRFALALLVVSLSSVVADRAFSAPITGILNEVNGSGITGKFSLHPLSPGGTRITIRVEGLQPDVEYIAVYHTNSTCDFEADSINKTLVRFRPTRQGVFRFRGDVPETSDQIHGVSIHLGDAFGLVSCGLLN